LTLSQNGSWSYEQIDVGGRISLFSEKNTQMAVWHQYDLPSGGMQGLDSCRPANEKAVCVR